MELAGSVAIVTGAGRGLGRQVAEALAGKGVAVALAARSADQVEAAAQEIIHCGGKALALPTDITDPRQIETLVRTTAQHFGDIDILVNAAGSLKAIGPVWEADEAQWWEDVTINVRGTFLCCRAVAKQMVERGRGYIMNFVGGGVNDSQPYMTAYRSSKAMVMRFTECFAKEAAAAGVKVFAVDPGTVLTDMTRYILDTPAGQRYAGSLQNVFDQGRDTPPGAIAVLIEQLLSGRFDELAGRFFRADTDLDPLLAHSQHIVEQDLLTLRLRNAPS